jgi:hypothetical protein
MYTSVYMYKKYRKQTFFRKVNKIPLEQTICYSFPLQKTQLLKQLFFCKKAYRLDRGITGAYIERILA